MDSSLFAERQRLLDEFLAAGHFLREVLVDPFARLDERVLVRVVDGDARRLLDLLQEIVVHVGSYLERDGLHLLRSVGQYLLHVGGVSAPARANKQKQQQKDKTRHGEE